jgi:hypothetical protein
VKKFLLTVVVFFVLVSLLLTVLLGGTYYIMSQASFRIPEEKNIIVIGDSHTECAIDDSIFSRSFNCSQSGTEYLYSYIKLRKFLEVNPHIDTVFVSFHGGSIQKSHDKRIFEGQRIVNKVPKYISLFGMEEWEMFFDKSDFYSAIIQLPMRTIRTTLKFARNHALTFKDLYIGGYFYLDRDKLQRAIELEEENINAGIGAAENEYSEYQLAYLLKTVELCTEKGVALILFNAPTYNPARYGNLPALENYYNTYFPGVKYLDYSNFPLPDYGYGDIGHLNYKGARIFSQWLEENYMPAYTITE